MSPPPRRVRLRAAEPRCWPTPSGPRPTSRGCARASPRPSTTFARGDDALVDSARRFDCAGFAHDRLRVLPAAIERAVERLGDDLRAAVVAASAQVRIVAEALLPDDRHVTLPYGQRVSVRGVPVDSAGCYVPGGRAAYPRAW